MQRPYRDLVLAAQDHDAHKVADGLLGPRAKPVVYAKHIAKHKVGLDQRLWQRAAHVVRGAAEQGSVRTRAGSSRPHCRPSSRRLRARVAWPSLRVLTIAAARALPRPLPPQLLVREPYGVVQSFSKVLQPSLLELGYGVSACAHAGLPHACRVAARMQGCRAQCKLLARCDAG